MARDLEPEKSRGGRSLAPAEALRLALRAGAKMRRLPDARALRSRLPGSAHLLLSLRLHPEEGAVFRFAARLQSVSFATAFAVLVVCAPAEAVTFNVTKTNDSADGSCDADCSLREAVIAANAAGGADTVLLPAGAYDLTIADASAGIDEDAGATGDLDIAPGGLTLQGAGAVATSIDAKTLGNRIVHVLGYYSDSPIAIRGVTLEGGDSSAQGGSAEGGSSVRVDDSFPGLVVTLDDVVVDKSGAGASAVRSVATLVVTDCTFSENGTSTALALATANVNKSFSTSSATRIERTTFRQNDGFAITAVKNEDRLHNFELVNSTLSGNNAAGASGIYDAAIFSTNHARIWNTTIADGGGYGIAALADAWGTPQLEVQSSVFRSNALGNVMPTSATDGATLPISRGGNVVSDAGAGAFTQLTDKISINPLLLALADNGGKTLTYALAPTSPAVDAGLNSGTLGSCPAFDQRGEIRPQDGDGNGSVICDAGAVEIVPEPSTAMLALGAALALWARGAVVRGRQAG